MNYKYGFLQINSEIRDVGKRCNKNKKQERIALYRGAIYSFILISKYLVCS